MWIASFVRLGLWFTRRDTSTYECEVHPTWAAADLLITEQRLNARHSIIEGFMGIRWQAKVNNYPEVGLLIHLTDQRFGQQLSRFYLTSGQLKHA